MKKIINAAVAVCVSIALIYGCDSINNPVSVNEPDVNRSVSSTTTEDVNKANLLGYIVNFDGKKPGIDEDGNEVTIFNYSVIYDGADRSSNNFFLEVPECAEGKLKEFHPSNSTRYAYVDPKSGMTGILWNSSLSRNTSKFSVTFSGDVAIGMVSTTIAGGNEIKSKKIAGPCKGLIEISGTVYIDTGGDDPSDTGIGNVLVTLKDADDENIIDEVSTDSFGWYSFKVVPGTYTLSVPKSLAGGTITYTGTFEPKEFKTDSDGKGNDFPYKADTKVIIKNLEDQTIVTNTQDIKFWIREVRMAANPNRGNTDVDEFLKKIGNKEFISGIDPNVFKITPFDFSQDKGDELANAKKALDILAPPNPNLDDEQLFKKELLAAMLNIVSGRGVEKLDFAECDTDDALCSPENFHLALLAYGINFFANPNQQFTIESQKLSISTTSISFSEGAEVFSTFNRTGSGGLN